MITINDKELCTILCALRESAAQATELAYLLPNPGPERSALLANAEVFSGLAQRLMRRESLVADPLVLA